MISILIPFYNAELYLHDCLNSILQQTETNWEVIAINDGSTDKSYDILQSYQKKDARIHCYQANGKGIIAALNQAYSLSSGHLITRMDADDVMESCKLGELKSILTNATQPTVATGLVRYFSDATLGQGYQRYENWLNTLLQSNHPYQGIYKECVVPSPCWMIRREDFDRIGAFDSPVYPEDYDLCFRFYKAGYKISASQKILHHWRDYPQRTSRNDPRLKDQGFLKLKIAYFQELEMENDDSITLWGAGNKGKHLAQIMIEENLNFRWVCNNPNKIDQIIYGVKIEMPHTIEDSSRKTIVAVSQSGAKPHIESFFRSKQLIQNKDYFYFL